MRYLPLVILVALAAAPIGCKRKRPAPGESGPAELASTLHLGDPRVADQLLSGFYEIEAHAWRWSARKFSVLLRPPAGSAQAGATLELHLTIPPVVIEKLNHLTLSGDVNGSPMAPETYTKPGDYVYQRDIPASAFHGATVHVNFELDQAIPPSESDLRELGVVVSSIRLALK